MEKARVTIQNETGLHARPASQFVKKASQFSAEVKVSKEDKEVNAKSIMGVMSLGAEKDTEVTLIADGADEKEAIEELENFIKNVLPEEEGE
jgi:phosphocarrier protein